MLHFLQSFLVHLHIVENKIIIIMQILQLSIYIKQSSKKPSPYRSIPWNHIKTLIFDFYSQMTKYFVLFHTNILNKKNHVHHYILPYVLSISDAGSGSATAGPDSRPESPYASSGGGAASVPQSRDCGSQPGSVPVSSAPQNNSGQSPAPGLPHGDGKPQNPGPWQGYAGLDLVTSGAAFWQNYSGKWNNCKW